MVHASHISFDMMYLQILAWKRVLLGIKVASQDERHGLVEGDTKNSIEKQDTQNHSVYLNALETT
jgi:hypothetical protein